MADGTSGGAAGRRTRTAEGSAAGRAARGSATATGPDVVPLPRPRPTRDAAKAPRRPSRGRLTGRAGILALTVCAIVVTLAYPLRQYLAQRSQISGLEHRNQVTRQQVADLQRELAQWSDPAFVAIQARERLHYVRPGEIGYIVPSPTAGGVPLGIPSPTQQAWYDRLWSTVTSPSAQPSGHPSAGSSPSPSATR